MGNEFGGDAWFLTLTLGSQYKTTRDGYLAIPKLWDSTRKAYQRWYGSMVYMAFVEGQQNRGGMPHFHILTDREPPTRRGRLGYVTSHGVHDFAVAYGWGYQAKLEIVLSSQAAVYVAKYASKGDTAMPRNFRRVRASQDFPKLPDLTDDPLIVPARDEDVAHYIDRVCSVTGLLHDEAYNLYRLQLTALHLARQAKDGWPKTSGTGEPD